MDHGFHLHIMILGLLVAKYLIEQPDRYSAGELTQLYCANTNNETFGVLAVKYRFHQYLKHQLDKIDLFINAQYKNGHKFPPQNVSNISRHVFIFSSIQFSLFVYTEFFLKISKLILRFV